MGASPSTSKPEPAPSSLAPATHRGSFVRTHSNLGRLPSAPVPQPPPTTAAAWYLCWGDDVASPRRRSVSKRATRLASLAVCCSSMCAADPTRAVNNLLEEAEELLVSGMVAYRTGRLIAAIQLLTEGLVKRRDEVRKFESVVDELNRKALGINSEASRVVAVEDMSRASSPTQSLLPSQPSHSGMLDGTLNVVRRGDSTLRGGDSTIRHLSGSRNPFIAPSLLDGSSSPHDVDLSAPNIPVDGRETARAMVMGWQRPEDNQLLQLSLAMTNVVSSRYSDTSVTFLLELGFILLQCGYRDAALMFFSEVKEMASQAVGKCLLVAMNMESAAPGSFSESLLKKTAIVKYTEACLGMALTYLCFHSRAKKRSLREQRAKQWQEMKDMVRMVKATHQQRYRRGCAALCASLNLTPADVHSNVYPVPHAVIEFAKRKRVLRADLQDAFRRKQQDIMTSLRRTKGEASSRPDNDGVHKINLEAIGPAVRMMYEQRMGGTIANDRVECSAPTQTFSKRAVSILVPASASPKRSGEKAEGGDTSAAPKVYSILFDVPAVLMKSRKIEETLARKKEEKRILKAKVRAFENATSLSQNRGLADTVLLSAPPKSIMKRRRRSLGGKSVKSNGSPPQLCLPGGSPQPTSSATPHGSKDLVQVPSTPQSPSVFSPQSGDATRTNSLQIQLNVPTRRSSIVPAAILGSGGNVTPVPSGMSPTRPLMFNIDDDEDPLPSDSLNRKETLAPADFESTNRNSPFPRSPAHMDMMPPAQRESSFLGAFPSFHGGLLAASNTVRGVSPAPRSPMLPSTSLGNVTADRCSSASSLGSDERHEDDELRDMAEELELIAKDIPDGRKDYMPKRVIGEVELPPEEFAYTSGSTSCGSSCIDELEGRIEATSPSNRRRSGNSRRVLRRRNRSSYSNARLPASGILRSRSSLVGDTDATSPRGDEGTDVTGDFSVSDFVGSSDELGSGVEGGETRIRATSVVAGGDGPTLALPASSPASRFNASFSSSESDVSSDPEDDGSTLSQEIKSSVAKCISPKIHKRTRALADEVRKSEFSSTSQAFRELGEAIQIVATAEHSRSLLLLPLFHLQGQLLMLTKEYRAATRTFQRCLGIVRSYADYRNSPGSDADLILASTVALLNLAKESFNANKDDMPVKAKKLAHPFEGEDGGAALSLGGGASAPSWKKGSLPHLLGVGSGTVLESAARLHAKQQMRSLSAQSLGKPLASNMRQEGAQRRGEAKVRIHTPAPPSANGRASTDEAASETYNGERRISEIVDKFLLTAALADPDFGTFEQTVRTNTLVLHNTSAAEASASPALPLRPTPPQQRNGGGATSFIRGADVLFPDRSKATAKPPKDHGRMARPTTLSMSAIRPNLSGSSTPMQHSTSRHDSSGMSSVT